MSVTLIRWHAAGIPEPAKQRSEIEKDAIERLVQTVIERHIDTTRNAETHALLTKDVREATEELARTEARLASNRQRMTMLLHETGCDSEAALVLAEHRSDEARGLDDELRQLQEKILIAGEGKTIAELEHAAAEADPDRLAAAAEQAGINHALLENQYREALTRLGKQQQRTQDQGGRGDAAILAGEAQQVLAKARAHAVRCARLEATKLVLERAIDNYRLNNESAILRRAERLFQRLTLGRYSNLRVEYENGKAKLRAVRPGEEVDVARALSDGTQDQLFLSLRLASIEQHLASQEPMPLVLDDIFINFDEGRTRAGLETLGEFAHHTQVLLLTHHSRTIELAKSTIPASVWMEHRLDDPLATA